MLGKITIIKEVYHSNTHNRQSVACAQNFLGGGGFSKNFESFFDLFLGWPTNFPSSPKIVQGPYFFEKISAPFLGTF